MYQYDEFDHQFVRERVKEFRGQVKRRIEGVLTEDEFKPFAATKWFISAASCLYAACRYSLRDVECKANAHAC